MTMTIELDQKSEIANFRLPVGLNNRLQELLDRKDCGTPLTDAEREEAQGLVEVAEFLTLLRLRSERLSN